MEFTPLFEGDIPSTCKRMAIKKKLLEKKKKENFSTYPEWYTRQSCPALIHLSQGLIPSILTTASL